MAVNFKLAYNQGYSYINLFPKTSVKSIQGNDNLLHRSTLIVVVPPTTDVIQTIPVKLNNSQKIAPFYVKLLPTGSNVISDYSTITNVKIDGDNLVLTRLYDFPVGGIVIELHFMESGVEI